MPSFDVVNEVDLQEVDNAVNNAMKILTNRYDFRGSNTDIALNKKDKRLNITTEDEMKLKAVEETLAGALVKRGLSPKIFDYGEIEQGSQGMVKRTVRIQEGIEKDLAKKIVKMIKDAKLKVQAQIQDDQIRVTGKSIDDLQEVIGMLKAKDLEVPLQFTNMKR